MLGATELDSEEAQEWIHPHFPQTANLGIHSSSAFLVCSGSCVFFLVQPSLLLIRWTCVSTPIPVTSPQATSMHRWAILGPTPGSFTCVGREKDQGEGIVVRGGPVVEVLHL